jgi:transposase
MADASGIRVLKRFACTLARYRSGILTWYDHPISTGPLEGTNNKIKTLKRQAYGFRDQEYFKLKIMALHHSRFELIG